MTIKLKVRDASWPPGGLLEVPWHSFRGLLMAPSCFKTLWGQMQHGCLLSVWARRCWPQHLLHIPQCDIICLLCAYVCHAIVCNISIGRLQERNTPCGMTSMLTADVAVGRKWPWKICSVISRYCLPFFLPARKTHSLYTQCDWVHNKAWLYSSEPVPLLAEQTKLIV